MTADPDMLAAELAMGLLEGEERAAALRRTLSDPAFAREVEWWRAHLAELLVEYPHATPPADLIASIGAPPARRWFQRPLYPVALAAAAAAAVFVVSRPVPPVPPSVNAPAAIGLVAALAAPDGSAAPIAAVIDRASGAVRIAGTDVAPVGRVAELWVIDNGTPRALGLLNRTAATRLTVTAPQRAALRPGAVLAISIEPIGGSPQATPTGPVVATGPLVEA